MRRPTRNLLVGSGTAALAAGVAALAVTSAGGAPQAQTAKLPHGFCFRALTGTGQNKLSTKQAQAVGSGKEQLVRLHCTLPTGRRGPTGAPGAAGPPGPGGPAGPAGTFTGPPGEVVVPRTPVQFAPGFMTDGGNVQNLAKIGPIHIDGLCRHTFSPGTGGGANGGPTSNTAAPFLPNNGGESEAHIIVWTETGSLTFKGAHGHRENVPSGPPDYAGTTETVTSPNSTPGRIDYGPGHNAGGSGNGTVADQPIADPVTGEGQHLFLSASNENPDETRATDPAADNPNDSGVRKLSEYPAFNGTDGVIATSEGHVVLANALAGMDVLGAYGECVFSGVFDPIS